MWQLAPDYVTRVLRPAAQRFAARSVLPDVFARYDLPLDVASPDEITRALSDVQKLWEQLKADPVVGKLVIELLSPPELERAEKTLLEKQSRLLERKFIEKAQREAAKNSVARPAAKGATRLVVRDIAERTAHPEKKRSAETEMANGTLGVAFPLREVDARPGPAFDGEPAIIPPPPPKPPDEELREAGVTAGDGLVEGRWEAPKTGRVRVFKAIHGETEGTLDHIDDHGFVDYAVRNGVTYDYRLALEIPDDPSRLSPGLRFSVRPAEILPPVDGLTARMTSEGVRLSWPMLRRGSPVVLRFPQAPPWPMGRVIGAGEHAGGNVIPLSENKEYEALDTAPLQKRGFYVVLAVSGERATVGKSIRFLALSDLTALSAQNVTEYVEIRWHWPPGCRKARIRWRRGEPPASADDPDSDFTDMGKGDYISNKGSLQIKPPGSGRWYVRGFAWNEESQGYSAGISLGANAYFQRPKARVEYRLTRGVARHRMTVTIKSDSDIILPSLVIVAGPGDLQPLAIDQGQQVTRFPAIPLGREVPVQQRIDLKPVRRPAYLKAFFEERGAYDDVDLRHPEPSQARLR